MDLLEQLGELALGSRLRRISNTLMTDGTLIYRLHQLDFQPRWFPAFYFLAQRYPGSAGITDIAESTRVSHPLINRFVNELLKRGYLDEISNEADKRKRLVRLSKTGEQLSKKLRPVWEEFELSMREILCEADPQFMQTLSQLEARLATRGLLQTYSSRQKAAQYRAIKISINAPEHFAAFRDINMEWLEHYFKVEEKDREVLSSPQPIIDKGGYIFAAELEGRILGVCALLKLEGTAYELAKMGVLQEARGKQIGRRLLDAAIELARREGAEAIYLESNNRLKTALNLYLRAGFQHTGQSHTGKSAYQRANVFMKLAL